MPLIFSRLMSKASLALNIKSKNSSKLNDPE